MKLLNARVASLITLLVLASCAVREGEQEPEALLKFSNDVSTTVSVNGSNVKFEITRLSDGTTSILNFNKGVTYLHVVPGWGGLAVDESGRIGLFRWPINATNLADIKPLQRFKQYRVIDLADYDKCEAFQAALFRSGHALISLPDRLRIYVIQVPGYSAHASEASINLQQAKNRVNYSLSVKWKDNGKMNQFIKEI